MLHNYESYSELPLLEFPLKVGELEIKQLTTRCGKCKRRLSVLRGNVRVTGETYDFDCAGVCFACKHIVTVRFRYYSKQRRAIGAFVDGTWREVETYVGWRAKLVQLRDRFYLRGGS